MSNQVPCSIFAHIEFSTLYAEWKGEVENNSEGCCDWALFAQPVTSLVLKPLTRCVDDSGTWQKCLDKSRSECRRLLWEGQEYCCARDAVNIQICAGQSLDQLITETLCSVCNPASAANLIHIQCAVLLKPTRIKSHDDDYSLCGTHSTLLMDCQMCSPNCAGNLFIYVEQITWKKAFSAISWNVDIDNQVLRSDWGMEQRKKTLWIKEAKHKLEV